MTILDTIIFLGAMIGYAQAVGIMLLLLFYWWK